jgi:phenylacetate-CoA ligase
VIAPAAGRSGASGGPHQPELETLPRERLEAVQLERLRWTLARARGNARYAARLGDARPDDVRALADWARLPFLRKAELRDAYPLGLACARPDQIRRVQMSSGSTGQPIVNPYTLADVEQWAEVMARCCAVAGIGPGDVMHISPSFGLFTGGFGFHYGAERLGAMVIPMGAGRTGLALQLMRDLGATVLVGIASYPLRLLEVAREEGFDLSTLGLRVGIFGSEMWTEAMRARIEAALGLTAYDLIGMTETGGPGLGIDCAARAGIHVWEDHVLCEVIDPATGAPRADGEEGELVVTTLRREGLPLIRYRTHDLTRVVSRERCACGRTHMRLDRLRGRTDDMVIYRGTNFYPAQVEAVLLRQPGAGHEYQIVLDRAPEGSDRLTVLLEAGPDFGADAVARLRGELRSHLNVSAEVTVLKDGEIPRAPGKAVRVVDRRR